jgi:hypothetical protein
MAINYISGAVNSASTSVNTISVTYSPTAGNTLVVFVGINVSNAGLTVVDNLSNSLTAGPTLTLGTSISSSCHYYTVPSGVTSITASWTTNRECGIVVLEYSGVVAVNASLSGNAVDGTSASPSITVTSQDANDYIVAGFVCSQVFTMSTGTQRQHVASGTHNYCGDNTSSTAGSITLGGSQTSANWIALAIELRASIGTPGVSSNQLMMMGCGG